MSKALRELDDLRKKNEIMEGHIKTMAQTIATMSVFLNILIKKSGLTNDELDKAIAEAAIERAKAKLVQSEGTGTTVSDSGNGNTIVSSATDGGNSSGSSSIGNQTGRVEEKVANEHRPLGNGSPERGTAGSAEG